MKVKAVASCQPIKPDKLEPLSRSMLINLRPRPTQKRKLSCVRGKRVAITQSLLADNTFWKVGNIVRKREKLLSY